MLSVVEAMAKKDGADIVSLNVFDFNTEAAKLYEKKGYKQVKRDRSYRTTYEKKL